MKKEISPQESEIIELAWRDDISFDIIQKEVGLKESEVIAIMRRSLKPSSFRLWRERVSGRMSKHEKKTRHQPFDKEENGLE